MCGEGDFFNPIRISAFQQALKTKNIDGN